VKGLDVFVTEDELKSVFNAASPGVSSVKIIPTPPGQPRAGLVNYPSEEMVKFIVFLFI
jgi:hypothetical protein